MGSHSVFFDCLALSSTFKRRMVSKHTDICIEGFPRSANSFALHAFLMSNPEAKVAHHLHAPMQILRAVKFGIPCVVLIREPINVLASLLVADDSLSLDIAIKSYIDFYRRILGVKRRVVVAEFHTVTNDFCSIISEVNRRYGKSFLYKNIGEFEQIKIFADLHAHHLTQNNLKNLVPIPTAAKSKLKEKLIPKLKKNIHLKKAEMLYRDFITI